MTKHHTKKCQVCGCFEVDNTSNGGYDSELKEVDDKLMCNDCALEYFMVEHSKLKDRHRRTVKKSTQRMHERDSWMYRYKNSMAEVLAVQEAVSKLLAVLGIENIEERVSELESKFFSLEDKDY